MSTIPLRAQRAFVSAILAAVLVLAITPYARAQQLVAMVDGEPVTELDILQRTKLIEMSTHKAPARKEVLNGLIDEILEVREAKKFSIDVPDADVNDAFSGVASGMNIDAQKLTQILVNGGASAETLKRRLRAQMAWTGLVRGRYKASLEIRDSDVEAQLELHKPEEKNQVGYEYGMRPILFLVPHGSPDGAFEARKREAEALRARFQSCNDGIPFARALREVAVRDAVIKSSADLQSELRAILDKTEAGHLTPPEQTSEGIQVFAMCSKKETKTDTPGMRAMRDEMFQQKFGTKAKRYLEQIRRAAMIEYKQ